MGFKFNPITGQLDLVNPSTTTAVAEFIDVTFNAAENISALKVVYADTATTVRVASSGSSNKPIGVATAAASIGNPVTIRTFGELSDASFLFAFDTPLFLNNVGSLSSTAVTSGYHTEIGHGLGTGKIFINIKNQITL